MLVTLLLAAPLLAPAAAPCPPTAGPVPSARRGADEVETVEIETSDKLTLTGDYWAPRRKSGRSPAALLVHDAGGDRHELARIGERLQKQGFAVLAIDLRGHGNSRADGMDWKTLDADKREKLWVFATRDLDAAAAWLRERREVHATNLNLVGMGAGCTLAVKHAGRDGNVRSLVLLQPPTEKFGFDLEGDILEIEGLPTLAVAAKTKRAVAENLVSVANGDGARPWVELDLRAKVSDGLLDDRKLPAEVARWMQDKAEPKRGASEGDAQDRGRS